jgi:hypothetical protein
MTLNAMNGKTTIMNVGDSSMWQTPVDERDFHCCYTKLYSQLFNNLFHCDIEHCRPIATIMFKESVQMKGKERQKSLSYGNVPRIGHSGVYPSGSVEDTSFFEVGNSPTTGLSHNVPNPHF